MSFKKKRVLVLLPYFDLGGAEKQGLYIAKSMHASEQYEVEVWSFAHGSSGLLLKDVKSAGIPHKILNIQVGNFSNKPYRLLAYFRLWWALVKGKFDAIIPYTYHCNVMSATLYRFAGVKNCIWLQIAMEFHMPVTIFERIAKFFKPTYAANSIAAAKYIGERHSIDASKVAFVPNPFETKTVKNDKTWWRNKLQLNEGDIVMMMAANFFPEKDHETVMRGVLALSKKYPQLKLIFAGGSLNNVQSYKLRALAFDLQMQYLVQFIGPTDDIPGLLQVTDIGILSSRSEGSPNSLIEYMGYGVPVIATNIGPIAELLGNDYPYLFEVENLNDFIAKADTLLGSLASSKELVERNRTIIQQQYTVKTNLEGFQILLKD